MKNYEDRKEQIIKILSARSEPVTGNRLSELLNVSRQIIVQDIALLRARGYAIIATPQGYLFLNQTSTQKYKKVLACQHSKEQLHGELEAIIACGATILDVIIEHPLYGDLKGMLNIRNKQELEAYLVKLQQENALPLSTLTDGVHLHTVEADSMDTLRQVEERLKALGTLMESN
jgi:transcriptional regulator of NAD metabolism